MTAPIVILIVYLVVLFVVIVGTVVFFELPKKRTNDKTMSEPITIGSLMNTIEKRDSSIKQLQLELDDMGSVNRMLSGILDRTANALHGGPKENGLWSFHDLPELAIELRNRATGAEQEQHRHRKENDILRGLVAKGQGDCVYCGLKAEDMGKCAFGFPGCARMDDIMAAQETEKDRKIDNLRLSLLTLKIKTDNGEGEYLP